jgi:hypothetical protein
MLKLFPNHNRISTYGVLYLHVERNGEPIGVIELGSALCRLIGQDGYGVTAHPEGLRFCVWGANEWDFSNLEQEQVLLTLHQSQEADAERPAEYSAERCGTLVRLVVWRNGSYAIDFHSRDGYFSVHWEKGTEPFSVGAKCYGDLSVALSFAEAVLRAEQSSDA